MYESDGGGIECMRVMGGGTGCMGWDRMYGSDGGGAECMGMGVMGVG